MESVELTSHVNSRNPWPAVEVCTTHGLQGTTTEVYVPYGPSTPSAMHCQVLRAPVTPTRAHGSSNWDPFALESDLRGILPLHPPPQSPALHSSLPPLPSFDHLPPTPRYCAGAELACRASPLDFNIFRNKTEDVFHLHYIDNGWRPYIRTVIVARLTELEGLRCLLAWGWEFAVAKSFGARNRRLSWNQYTVRPRITWNTFES